MRTRGNKDIHRLEFGYSDRNPQALRIETPGGCVTIRRGLTSVKGAERIRIDVEANGNRFAGEVPWWFVEGDRRGMGSVGFLEKEQPKPKPKPSKTVGELRAMLASLPDDAEILPDWAAGFEPSQDDPCIEFVSAEVCERRDRAEGKYLSLGMRLEPLNG